MRKFCTAVIQGQRGDTSPINTYQFETQHLNSKERWVRWSNLQAFVANKK